MRWLAIGILLAAGCGGDGAPVCPERVEETDLVFRAWCGLETAAECCAEAEREACANYAAECAAGFCECETNPERCVAIGCGAVPMRLTGPCDPSRVADHACIPAYPTGADGRLDCMLLETLPAGDTCDAHMGRWLAMGGARETCLVGQLTESEAQARVVDYGWALDRSSSAGAALECPTAWVLDRVEGASYKVSCVNPIIELGPGRVIGAPCGDPACSGDARCDTVTSTCQIPCVDDSVCPAPLACHPDRLFCGHLSCGSP